MSNDPEWRPCSCANCTWRGTEDQTKEVRDFWSRIEPGDTMPAGDCPECGAFAFLDAAEPVAIQAASGPHHVVRWAFDAFDCATPLEAARKAFERMQAPINLDDPCAPGSFEVLDRATGETVTVDLCDHPAEA